ncbi:MAG: hypothetical protein A2586_01570 [Candidatus Harrisonbacteria bacterium RIFOXYD1_FULL_40_9]|uniref:Bacterial type II secretion system protein E domain-containing protein n=1 Tax=Candidatus Harrisonbacteria bacterium RIFOXYD1_FULL_40_9 TaxID=1798412 RepID=A0A1G2A0S6_9BACT|nr:MAG: hypothetical protein A2586_01570 [Candidatus Harrisonbacteria bacterium RIFOXYD1_FULL_40_9]
MSHIKKSILNNELDRLRKESEERVAERRALHGEMRYLNLHTIPVQVEALGLISEVDARKGRLAVIEKKERKNNEKEVAIVVFDPKDVYALGIIEALKAMGFSVQLFTGSLSGLERVWGFYQFVSGSSRPITGRVSIDEGKGNTFKDWMRELINLQSVKNALHNTPQAQEALEALFVGALLNGASDIHIEPTLKAVLVRYRIDGVLYVVGDDYGRDFYSMLVTRIKLLSKVKLNVKNESQDGRFSISVGSRDIEVRVSVIPAEFGEMVVMRVLDPLSIQVEIDALGLRADDLVIIRRSLALPNGMIINTGPTGSGKTTSLYAFLRHIANPQTKVVTIEDPIEYRLEWVEQTQIDKNSNYTFANGLRAILRQDPDVILVGEIRDEETADVAIQSSLTGHLVFSTLHTNEAAGAIPRLINLGISPAVIGSALNLIIAQRLLRKLCEYCREEKKIDASLAASIEAFIKKMPDRVDKAQYKIHHIYDVRSNGCEKCGGLGYKGRIAVFELLEISKKLHELIENKASIVAFRDAAEKEGMVSLQADGILKVLSGITTFEEVEKVTGPLNLLKTV